MFNNEHDDGVDRRGFLRCMAWAGTGAFFMVEGGILKSYSLSALPKLPPGSAASLSFVQISDSHMGFNKAANPDVVGTLKTELIGGRFPKRFELCGIGDLAGFSHDSLIVR